MQSQQVTLFSGGAVAPGTTYLFPSEGIASRAKIDVDFASTGSLVVEGALASSAAPIWRTLIVKSVGDVAETKITAITADGCYEVDTSGFALVRVNPSANATGITVLGTLVVG